MTMLSQYIRKVNNWLTENKNDLKVAEIIFFVSLARFGLGRLSILWPKKEPVQIMTNDKGQMLKAETEHIDSSSSKTNKQLSSFGVSLSSQGKYIASKSGAAYHYPWCPGALQIKEENKIFFNIKEEAEKRGYKPAGNCPGL